MLSKRDIEKELGKGIAIYPFSPENIKDNSVNLTLSDLAWGTVDHDYWYNPTRSNSKIYIDDSLIPSSQRNSYKKQSVRSGHSVVVKKQNHQFVLFFPHSVTYVETKEVISTGNNIGGTCHSKVGIAARGIGHIGTMMGPNYSGHCFVPLINATDELIEISVDETFFTVVFNHLDTPIDDGNVTTGGHTDKFSSLHIYASQEQLNLLNEDWKRSHKTVLSKMKQDETYSSFRHSLRVNKIKSFFSKNNLLFAVCLLVIFLLLGLLANYVDSVNGTEVWTNRFWSVFGAGVVVFILQQFRGKN